MWNSTSTTPLVNSELLNQAREVLYGVADVSTIEALDDPNSDLSKCVATLASLIASDSPIDWEKIESSHKSHFPDAFRVISIRLPALISSHARLAGGIAGGLLLIVLLIPLLFREPEPINSQFIVRSAHAFSQKGGPSTWKQVGEVIQVSSTISPSAYCYIIAFNPDGTTELVYPLDEVSLPEKLEILAQPSGRDNELHVHLNNGTGLQVVVLLASRKPLPPFLSWQRRFDPEQWKPVQYMPRDLGWHYKWTRNDDENVDITGTPTIASNPAHDAFLTICRAFQSEPEIDIIEAIAFPVVDVD